MAQEGVGKDDELSHDGGDGDLGGLPGFDELLVERSTVLVEPGGNDRRHIKGLAKGSPVTANVSVALP